MAISKKAAPKTASQKSVLMVAHDVVGEKMAGAGIRYFMLAEQLAKHFRVTLAVPNETSITGNGYSIVQYKDRDEFPALIDEHDFLFVQLLEPSNVRYAHLHHKPIIYDFYNLIPIEYLGSLQNREFDAAEADKLFTDILTEYRLYMASGSFFVCSNERQADFWMGMLTANQALLPSAAANRSVSDIVGLVPFGLTDAPPKRTKPALKGVVPGIEKDDFVVLWAGGIWDWFDPLTPIRALAKLTEHPDIKLVFMGTRHPNAAVSQTVMVDRAIALAKELEVYDKQVFFLEGWLDFGERANYLLDADAAISTHFDTLESRYSFRTRILDHFWAGLPSILTKGDWFAGYVGAHQLGLVTGFEDVDGVTAAILELYENPAERRRFKQPIAKAAGEFTWERVSEELIRFISSHSPREAAETAQAKSGLALLDPANRLIDEHEALSRDLNQAKVDYVQLQNENIQLHKNLDAITNSRRWKLMLFMEKFRRGQ